MTPLDLLLSAVGVLALGWLGYALADLAGEIVRRVVKA